MSDQVVIDEKPTIVSDPFDGNDKPIESVKKETVPDEKKETPVVEGKKEEIVIEDGRTFLKEKLGFDNWDAAKTEIESLKNKVATPAEKKYFNEESRKLEEAILAGNKKEVYNILHKQEQLSSLIEGEVTKDNAPAIIKAAMKEKYTGLKDDQITYKFNKQFAVPKEPVIEELESEKEFNERKEQWQEQVANIEMDLLIEANLARPELEKLRSELKLSEPEKIEATKKELTPEELAEIQEKRTLFLNDADAALKQFEGFNVSYKDKDVEVQSTYKLSPEENAAVLSRAKLFVEGGLDANAIFGQRWAKDGKFDFNQFSKDLAALDVDEKRSQKYMADTAGKAKFQYMKGKHQIDLGDGNGNGDLQLEDKDLQKKKEDAIWN